MTILRYPDRNQWTDICRRPQLDMSQLNNTVTTVLNDIRTRGDAAVREYEQRFDHVSLDSLAVSDKEIESARSMISQQLLDAITLAHDNIRRFHESQRFSGDMPRCGMLAEERGHRACWSLYPWWHGTAV